MSELKITPKGNFCYCLINKVEEVKTAGGVILPGDRSEGTRLAKVMAKGPDVSAAIEVGDIYAVQWFAGTVVNIAESNLLDNTHRLMGESELMAKVEEIDGDT